MCSMCVQLLTTPVSEVIQKDGSIESFKELLEDIANPTSLATFDPEIFKASLEGVLSSCLGHFTSDQ